MAAENKEQPNIDRPYVEHIVCLGTPEIFDEVPTDPFALHLSAPDEATLVRLLAEKKPAGGDFNDDMVSTYKTDAFQKPK